MPNRPPKTLATLMVVLFPAPLLALAAKAEAIVVVADTRGLTGWRAWYLNLYNDNHLLFALLTVTTVPLLALLLGRITSWCMGRLGINLRTRQLAEH
jgi:hypothetical protein